MDKPTLTFLPFIFLLSEILLTETQSLDDSTVALNVAIV